MKNALGLTSRGPLLFVALAIAVLLIALAIVEAIGGQARPEPAPWAEYLKSMEDALAAGDARAADWLLRQAHWVALGSRRWEGMLEVGDAAVRAGNVTAARTAYLTAAYRARRLRSFEGILAAVEAFAALGDREVAGQWLGVANELAKPNESARARVRAVAESLNGHALTSELER
ncbi:MAG TPA: hypothetical protein VLG10_12695 [Methylomirabilota bacterium]|nr:hypothetical protein [Methylomirabilota bacterium]